MAHNKKKTDAVAILHRRYIKGDAEREASVQEERVHGEIARMIRSERLAAGLTQRELAKQIGTQQSVISQIEDAGYYSYSVRMLVRVSRALGLDLDVKITARRPE